jgi:hypothetical protein
MATFFNVGRKDRTLRVVAGISLGLASIFISGDPRLRWGLVIAGVSVILSGFCGI